MNKKSKLILLSSIVFFAVFCIITMLLSKIFFADVEGITLWVTLIESVGLVITILVAVIQFGESKEISRADFIVQLNGTYVENQDYINVYKILQNCLDGKCAGCLEGKCTIELDKSVISNYLTFFETVYILYKRGVISFDIIDDLFAYRFFLAVHSELFQREKLMAQPENFKNIYKLENEWLKYRIKVGKLDKERLEEATASFNEYILAGGEGVPCPVFNNVYEARTLCGLVGERDIKN